MLVLGWGTAGCKHSMCRSFSACSIGLELLAGYFAAEKYSMKHRKYNGPSLLLLERLYCIHHGVNLEVKLGVGSKTGSKNSVLAFLKYTDGSDWRS